MTGTRYATCDYCNQEMDHVACTQTVFDIAGGTYQRIPYGPDHADVDFGPGFELAENCNDCNTPLGGLHHPGCDVERCPRCKGQNIACDCDGPEDDEDA